MGDFDTTTSMQTTSELLNLIQYEQEEYVTRQRNLQHMQAQVDAMRLTVPKGILVQVLYSNQLDFNRCDRVAFNAIRSQFPAGTKWHREVDGAAINYITKIDGITYRFWQTELPPSCRLVERLIEVPAQPAHFKKQIVVECKQTEQEKDEDND